MEIQEGPKGPLFLVCNVYPCRVAFVFFILIINLKLKMNTRCFLFAGFFC